jgi:hypothetical protein
LGVAGSRADPRINAQLWRFGPALSIRPNVGRLNVARFVGGMYHDRAAVQLLFEPT